jgi:hypothetical protein
MLASSRVRRFPNLCRQPCVGFPDIRASGSQMEESQTSPSSRTYPQTNICSSTQHKQFRGKIADFDGVARCHAVEAAEHMAVCDSRSASGTQGGLVDRMSRWSKTERRSRESRLVRRSQQQVMPSSFETICLDISRTRSPLLAPAGIWCDVWGTRAREEMHSSLATEH